MSEYCAKFSNEKIDWKVLVFCTTCRKIFYLVICMLNYPENETLPLGDLVPPKPRILEVWVWVMSTKSLVKKFWPLGVRGARCCAGSVHSYIGGYVLKYVVKYIVIPCYL